MFMRRYVYQVIRVRARVRVMSFREEGVLFGAEFQKKIQEEKEETRAGLLALGAPPKGTDMTSSSPTEGPFKRSLPDSIIHLDCCCIKIFNLFWRVYRWNQFIHAHIHLA